MGPCGQIPNHHSGYLLQSHAVEIEMYFPNQSWSWDGISSWLVWPMPEARKGSIKELCWKVCLHIVYPIQGIFLCLCTMGSAHFTNSPPTPLCELHAKQSPQFSTHTQASLLEVTVSTSPYLHLNATLLVKISILVLPPSTHTYTLDVMSPSFDLRTFWALNMVQFTFCFRKLSYSSRVSKECIILAFGFP